MKKTITLVISLLLLSSCDTKITQTIEADPYKRWKEKNIHDYTIEQKRICNCPLTGEIVRISVRSDTIASVIIITDESVVLDPFYLPIDSLFGIINSNNYDSIFVRYNEKYGFPEYLVVNPQSHPADGGIEYATNLQKLTIHLENGADQIMFPASDFKQNVYFFLDTLYRNLYNKNYFNRYNASYKTPPMVTALDVYIKKEVSQTDKVPDTLLYAKASDGKMSCFYKLVPDKHYEAYWQEGYIRFDTTITSIDEVAIYLRTEDESINKGNYGDTSILWTLKPGTAINKAEDDPARFYLMWRNVYDLDTDFISSFNMSVWREKNGEDSTRYTKAKNGMNKLISSLCMLTNDVGQPLTDYIMIYDVQNAYMIIPPYDTCSTCNEPFNNPLLGNNNRDSILYRFGNKSKEWLEHKSFYYFITSGGN